MPQVVYRSSGRNVAVASRGVTFVYRSRDTLETPSTLPGLQHARLRASGDSEAGPARGPAGDGAVGRDRESDRV